MRTETERLIREYVNENIDSFHSGRIQRLRDLHLKELLRNKNPYLFRAKNLNRAPDLINALLEARLSSSEEGSFGGFLENLAIFVAEITGGGQKSAAKAIDIELTRRRIRYLIAVKSGRNWGNSSQQAALRRDFKNAVRVLRQSKRVGTLQPTLRICYGNFKTVNNGEFLHIGGQSFWHLISGDSELYIDLVKPLGHKAEEHDRAFRLEKDNTFNRLTLEFIEAFCERTGAIDWPRLVCFVSGNLEEKKS